MAHREPVSKNNDILRFILIGLAVIVVVGLAVIFIPKNNDEGKPVVVTIKTSMGNIDVELNESAAPNTVANFLSYVDEGFYDGLVFHRVIDGFMIQGGGFTPDGNQKETKAPIALESDNGLKNDRGTIAMARTMDPNSATSQFFINTVDNDFRA